MTQRNCFFIEVVRKTNKNKAKKQKVGFLGMLLSTAGASLLGNLLAGKEVTIRTDLKI